jgi:uncharacterized protein (DUF3820 family)
MTPAIMELRDDLNTRLLKIERRLPWDTSDQANNLSLIKMPFGKYIGKELGEIPLKYLDETVAVMPPTYFVRRVIQFIDLAMEIYGDCGTCPNRANDASFNALQETQEKEAEAWLKSETHK